MKSCTPAIRALRERAEHLRQHEVERAAKALARGDDPRAVLESLSQGLTNKFLHAPTRALNGADGEERDQLIATLGRLYAIPKEG